MWSREAALAVAILCGTVRGGFGEAESATSRNKPDILRLHEDLFETSGYNSNVRPVRDYRRPINVTLDLALAHIIDLDEKDQILTVDIWLRMKWTDEFLTWNVSEYGGIETVTTRAERIWRPDLFLYHNVNHEFDGWLDEVVVITSDGLVDWKAPAVAMSACPVDVSDFPFDKQRCKLQFGSWNHDGRYIDYFSKNNMGDLASFIRNAEWEVPELVAKRSNPLYNGVPYPDVTFTIHMTRRSTFYVINMFLPCVLLAFVVGATFYLPPDCGEKISFGVAVLLSLAVFQLLVAEAVPRSENIPAIGRFIFVSLALMALSLLSTAFVITLGDSVHDTKPVPGWARRVFLKYVSKALLMGDQSKHNWEAPWDVCNAPSKQLENDGLAGEALTFQNGMCSDTRRKPTVYLPAKSIMKIPASTRKQLECLLQINGAIEEISGYLKKMDTVKYIHNEWKTLAIVVDRIFLVLYIIASALALVITLLNVQ
ncbi:PREDICTED: neuronal acetylcholine receptor subunit alpha-10-like [Branchiostoma belcheri]|uniref:Neuronal acetylcholine receptor subunit alpha-10-like n=1 Tax=Branchiostoma belcheri TaxID=7741 RepID=A0A6P5A4X6_BRABE|nr:PREDICTED: neuronal acetylcholine receptor subunit alpha-10-like [Branchiostoma belcheri]